VPPELPERLTTLLADRYRVERELGSGGMATVYLAHDVRHDRKVALKVLKPELAAVIGAARFLAEIKTTANLQNPHILPLHDSGEIDGTVFYVMPFVDGESLRDRLTREKQLPIPDAIRISTAVADALQYAHSHGVIHRDVKPENILLHDGHAVVADFGIALAASSAGSRMTETGMSLGTPHYMSPEQAMGERDLDARTDIYALGCVLYEMLTGLPPFTGPTAQSIVAKVITENPVPPSKLRSTVNEQLDDAVLTSLEKLPADRFGTAAEFANSISASSTTQGVTRARQPARVTAGPWRRVSAALALSSVALLALSAWALVRDRRSLSGPAVYDAALPDSALMSFIGAVSQSGYGTGATNISISSDSKFAVYLGLRRDSTILWYRSLRDEHSNPIEGTRGASGAQISPDGSRIAFLESSRVMVVPTTGGSPKQLMVAGIPATLQWLSPRSLLVLHEDGNKLTWLDAETGPTKEVNSNTCTFGRFMPETQQLMCPLSGLRVLNPETGKQEYVRVRNNDGSVGGTAQGSDFRLVDGRYLVFVSTAGELSAAPYDSDHHLLGRSVSLVPGIRREGAGPAQYDVAANGTLVYAAGDNAQIVRMVELRPGGAPEPLAVEQSTFQRFDMSRDKHWLAAVVQGSPDQELRVYNLKDGQSFTWLRAPAIRHPLWNTDGTRLLVWVRDSVRSALLYGSPASAASPDTLFSANAPETAPEPIDFHDEHTVVATDASRVFDLLFDPSVRPARFTRLGLESRFAIVSPGGKRICYQTVDGRVMVTSFPVPGQRVQVAAQGVEPLWLSDTEVLFRSGVSWYASHLDAATGEPTGSPALWANDPRFSDTSGWSNRVSQDGGIIYVQGPEQSTARFLRVVPGWVSRMKVAVDSANR
jgi:eukaryotic-like serine/threonine-protein kinase